MDNVIIEVSVTTISFQANAWGRKIIADPNQSRG
jgi:hypothetical protein